MERLKKLQQYLADAMLNEDDNKLYIQDLKDSIVFQQTFVDHGAIDKEHAYE